MTCSKDIKERTGRNKFTLIETCLDNHFKLPSGENEWEKYPTEEDAYRDFKSNRGLTPQSLGIHWS